MMTKPGILAPYPLETPGTDYPPPVVYATYNPYPQEQLDPTEKVLIAQKETNVAEIVMTMTAEPTKPTGTPEPTLTIDLECGICYNVCAAGSSCCWEGHLNWTVINNSL